MNEAEVTRISRMLSKTLRHDPGRLGITLDESGWVEADTLVDAVRPEYLREP